MELLKMMRMTKNIEDFKQLNTQKNTLRTTYQTVI